MILIWTAVSYIPAGDIPSGIPRRLFSPNPWSPGASSNWLVIKVATMCVTCLVFPHFFEIVLLIDFLQLNSVRS